MFPTLSEYNKTIQSQGANAFRTLNNVFFIPARTSPIKIYSFGSGSYAVVFKALENNKEIAVRCFIGSDDDYVERYRKIDNYLRNIDENWKVNIQFLDNEIKVDGKYYPVLKMDWIDGILLNKYIDNNLYNNGVLSKLQKQFVKISNNLEDNSIAHGDIQCGNIIVKEINGKPIIKLIDYDGFFIPNFRGAKQKERGRAEFQHPNRSYFAFNEKIDRFSFWVILCALEALKFDKTLWKEIMQGGFNTLDNLLFVANDFNNPDQSQLFNRLKNLNQPSLNFYIEQIKNSLITSTVGKIKLFGKNENEELQIIENEIQIEKSITSEIQSSHQIEEVNIASFPTGASVRNKNFENIGKTPIKIDRSKYLNEEIKIIFGTKSKSIIVDEFSDDIFIDFDKIIVNKPIIEKEEPIVVPIVDPNPGNTVNPIIWIVIILVIGFAFYHYNTIDYNNGDSILDSLAVETVDTTAAVADTAFSSPIDTAFVDTDTIATTVESQPADTVASVVQSNVSNIDFASDLYRNFFVNTWRDDNSVFTFFDSGNCYIKWDNGDTKWTTWGYYNGKLYIGRGINDALIRQYVLSYEDNSFRYMQEGETTIYRAYKVGN